MTKSKVGAEPKKQRVRHAITKSEGIHEGIHRDEYGYYDSSYHCYCFAYGYFFHRGKGLAEKLTLDYIKNNWDREGWYRGIKDVVRYYNLQDKLSFPLDRTTEECMKNHLIHLPSGRTIEAVGTIDI